MTLLEIKRMVASYLDIDVGDLYRNGTDMCLNTINQVRRQAELLNDFEFSRKLVTVSVDGVTGGSLDDAVIYGTATAAKVKTVIEMGFFDDAGNLRPTDWTTVAASLERQRQTTMLYPNRYPTDGEVQSAASETPYRLTLSNRTIYLFPKNSELTADLTVGIEAYTFHSGWTVMDSTSDDWTVYGEQYLLWGTVVQLNYRFKEFVPRQEGNLAAPVDLMNAGLEALKQWDLFTFEQYRRHG